MRPPSAWFSGAIVTLSPGAVRFRVRVAVTALLQRLGLVGAAAQGEVGWAAQGDVDHRHLAVYQARAASSRARRR